MFDAFGRTNEAAVDEVDSGSILSSGANAAGPEGNSIAPLTAGWAALALLLAACGGSGVQEKAMAGDKPPSATEVSGLAQNEIVEPAGAGGEGVLPRAGQFDLLCDVRGRVVADSHPRMRALPDEPNWESALHFVVDLRTMRFCEPPECASRIRRITAVNDREIILYDEPLVPGRQTLTYESVRRQDGHYLQQIVDDDGYTRRTEGACRVASFSGMPRILPD